MNFLILFAIVLISHDVHSCNHDGKLKGVGESCKDASECYSGGSTDAVSCKSGSCACNDGYLAQSQWFAPNDQRSVCLPAPYQDQSCSTVCQKPFTCASSRIPGMKTCQCRPPAISKDGLCQLECGSDEIYEGGECRKRCEIDENKERYLCKKIGKIGEKCDSKNLCWAPFSQCVNGICSCVNGFAPNAKKDACESTQRWCPFGSPIHSPDNKIIECKVAKRQSPPTASARFMPITRPGQLEDNCGSDQFCMLTTGDGYYTEGALGHCCQKPKLQCPYGLPHPNATCGHPIPNKSTGVSSAPYCPYGTHSCIRFALGGGFEASLCCATACGSNQILSNGICYPRRNYGDKCNVSEQCRGHVGICENGICTCGKEYVTEGTIGYHYCRRVCKENEVLIDSDRCAPVLKLGDKCDPQFSNQCPTNSYCSADKQVCDCFCGYVQLDNSTCGPQPSCPDIMASRNPALLDAAVNLTTFTVCRVAGGPKPQSSSAVELCPGDQYCSQYVPQYGLCCPRPEKPFCQNGARPGEKCDPKATSPCGPLGYCYRFLNPAGSDDDSDAHICCSILEVPLLNLTQLEPIG